MKSYKVLNINHSYIHYIKQQFIKIIDWSWYSMFFQYSFICSSSYDNHTVCNNNHLATLCKVGDLRGDNRHSNNEHQGEGRREERGRGGEEED